MWRCTNPDFLMFPSPHTLKNPQGLLCLRIFPRPAVSFSEILVYCLITFRKLVICPWCKNGFCQCWMETQAFFPQEVDGISMPSTVHFSGYNCPANGVAASSCQYQGPQGSNHHLQGAQHSWFVLSWQSPWSGERFCMHWSKKTNESFIKWWYEVYNSHWMHCPS